MKTNWKLVGICLFMASTLIVSCGNDDTKISPNTIDVSGIYVPSSITVTDGSLLQLQGSGLKTTDIVELVNKDETTLKFSTPVSSVQDQTFGIMLPETFVSGTYSLTLVRDEKRLKLGTININLVPDTEIPDKEGMTLKGVVFCNGKGVPNVVVSDGFEVTTTDEKGIYYLPSLKKNGYVFISVPGNYEVECQNNNEPLFYRRVTQNNTSAVEQKDFSLRRVDNTRHKLFVMTDFHLADRNNDLKQYSSFLADVNKTILGESLEGTKIYGLNLGDLSWELYWYSNDFALAECMKELNKIDCPIFSLPGNHDNDPYKANDWDAEQPFKNTVCPTYYSFNLGNVHYVMLDNIQYLNTNGAEGVIGNRNYNDLIVDEQMKWLEKDLSFITDNSTPVVVAMHANLYRNPWLAGSEPVKITNLQNAERLKDMLSRFSNVQVLTGHTHINFTIETDEWMEHNTAAVCATWWWTGKDGYANNHVCKDGSPGGYSVWEMNGKNLNWYYKGIGFNKDYQFRAYDLNETYITAEKFAPKSTDEKLAVYAGTYASKRNDNKVLINVWNYDSRWKIEVTENGKPLEVTRVYRKDPLHIISYEALRLNAGSTPTDSFTTGNTAHLFEVTASSPTSTLEIKVTDRFGNVYSETMTRPKIFSCNMK